MDPLQLREICSLGFGCDFQAAELQDAERIFACLTLLIISAVDFHVQLEHHSHGIALSRQGILLRHFIGHKLYGHDPHWVGPAWDPETIMVRIASMARWQRQLHRWVSLFNACFSSRPLSGADRDNKGRRLLLLERVLHLEEHRKRRLMLHAIPKWQQLGPIAMDPAWIRILIVRIRILHLQMRIRILIVNMAIESFPAEFQEKTPTTLRITEPRSASCIGLTQIQIILQVSPRRVPVARHLHGAVVAAEQRRPILGFVL